MAALIAPAGVLMAPHEVQEGLELSGAPDQRRKMIPASGDAGRPHLLHLVLLTALIGLSGCMLTEQVAMSEDTIYSPPLHWTVTKPKTWRFVSQREIRDAQHAVNTTNKLYNYAIYQAGAVPFVAIERVDGKNNDGGASFAIYRESLGEDRFASNDKILGQELWAYLYVVSGARIVGPTIHATIAGKKFANGRIQYTLRSKSGTTYQMQRNLWVRRSGLSAVVISASYELRNQPTAEKEIREILDSITERKDG
jgi:hypothetical protein